MPSLIGRALTLYRRFTGGNAPYVRLTLGVLASVGLGWLTSRGLNWSEVSHVLGGLSPYGIALALLVFLVGNVARAYGWQLLFLGERITVARLFLIQNMGLGLNNLLPVRIASEAIQFTLLTLRDGVSRGTALATLGMIRVMDIWATTLLLALGIPFVSGAGQLARYAVGGIIFSLLLLVLVHFLGWSSRGLPLMRRLPLLGDLASSVAELEGRKGRLAASLVVSMAHWIVLGLSGWVVAWSMDISLSPPQATLVVLAAIFFATTVPSLPGAIGTFEAAMVYVMGFFGVDKSVAFPYSLIMHALLFLPPTLLAAIFLPREGIGSLGELRSRAQSWKEDASPKQTAS